MMIITGCTNLLVFCLSNLACGVLTDHNYLQNDTHRNPMILTDNYQYTTCLLYYFDFNECTQEQSYLQLVNPVIIDISWYMQICQNNIHKVINQRYTCYSDTLHSYDFQDRAFLVYLRCPSSPSRINDYLAYRQRWKCVWIVLVHNCCVARMLPREVKLVLEWTGLPWDHGGSFHVKSSDFWPYFHGPPPILLKFGTLVGIV